MNKFVISRKYYMRGEFFMNNKISKYFFIILMIVFIIMLAILIYIKSSASDKSKEYATLKEKGEGEIIYLDDVIINSLNKLNNISYSRYSILIEEVKENDQQGSSQTEGGDPAQNKQEGSSNSEDGSQSGSTEVKSTTNATDQSENKTSRLTKNDSLLNSNYGEIAWNEISYSVETLFAAWPTITLDMKTLNVKDEDISNFSVTLDGVAQSIKNKDKNSALINLYNLYTMLPRFLSYFINDDAKINLYNTKAYLLNAYILFCSSFSSIVATLSCITSFLNMFLSIHSLACWFFVYTIAKAIIVISIIAIIDIIMIFFLFILFFTLSFSVSSQKSLILSHSLSFLYAVFFCFLWLYFTI